MQCPQTPGIPNYISSRHFSFTAEQVRLHLHMPRCTAEPKLGQRLEEQDNGRIPQGFSVEQVYSRNPIPEK